MEELENRVLVLENAVMELSQKQSAFTQQNFEILLSLLIFVLVYIVIKKRKEWRVRLFKKWTQY